MEHVNGAVSTLLVCYTLWCDAVRQSTMEWHLNRIWSDQRSAFYIMWNPPLEWFYEEWWATQKVVITHHLDPRLTKNSVAGVASATTVGFQRNSNCEFVCECIIRTNINNFTVSYSISNECGGCMWKWKCTCCRRKCTRLSATIQ